MADKAKKKKRGRKRKYTDAQRKRIEAEYNRRYYRRHKRRIYLRRVERLADERIREEWRRRRKYEYNERIRLIFRVENLQIRPDNLRDWKGFFGRRDRKLSSQARLIIDRPGKEWIIEDDGIPCGGYHIRKGRKEYFIATIKKMGMESDRRRTKYQKKMYRHPRMIVRGGQPLFLYPLSTLQGFLTSRDKKWSQSLLKNIPYVRDRAGKYWIPDEFFELFRVGWRKSLPIVKTLKQCREICHRELGYEQISV